MKFYPESFDQLMPSSSRNSRSTGADDAPACSPDLSAYAIKSRTKIIKLIEEVGRRHDRRQVFRDFVTMSAVALSKADLRQAEEREKLYMQTVRKYSTEEASKIAHMFAELQVGLEFAPRDILGEIFMSMELGNSRMGQFFTPYALCEVMAELTLSEDPHEKIKKNGYITVSEPASGSGATIIALMLAMENRGLNYQRHVHVTATDLDSTAASMAYVQLSLMHVPAVIVHGNTLTLEEYSLWYTPAHIFGNWSMRLDNARKHRLQEEAIMAAYGANTDEVEDTETQRPR